MPNDANSQTIRPSTVLDMTLPMFDRITVYGRENIRTLNNIIMNLDALYEALLRIEKEANGNDTDDQQG